MPSSSKLQAPLFPGMVPSSTMVMPLRQMRLPIFPLKTDWFFRMKSASNACPIASCSRIPDAPAPITTLIFPPFGLLAAKASSTPSTASAASSEIRASLSISAPARKLLLAELLILRPSEVKITVTAMLPMGRRSQQSSRRELYISTSLTSELKAAITLSVRGSRRRISASRRFSQGMTAADSVSRQSWVKG